MTNKILFCKKILNGLMSRNKMKIIKTLPFILLLFVNAQSCKSPTAPESLQPGRRDYVWELDTLNMPMNYLGAVWGAVPNDVWAVGAGGTYNDRLQHYDGKKWSAYNKEAILCTGNTLYGFSENNVWMGGGDELSNGAAIWHYDGNKWTRNYIYHVSGEYSTEVTDMWGLAPNNIFACGTINYGGSYPGGLSDSLQGFVLHYNGTAWMEVVKGNMNYQFLTIRSEYNFPNSFFNIGYKSYILSYKLSNVSSDSSIFAIYELDENRLQKIYLNTRGEITLASINVINGVVNFFIKNNFYNYKNNVFVRQFSIENPNIEYEFCGRNTNDIFFCMYDGIFHYNGSDFSYLYKNIFLGNALSSILIGSEVFFAIYNGRTNKNMVLHGKLK